MNIEQLLNIIFKNLWVLLQNKEPRIGGVLVQVNRIINP